MQLSKLNIGDKFTIDGDEGHDDYFDMNNYMKINPNTDNFKITHHDEWFDLDQYIFVLNLDTCTLGILLKTQEVTV